MRVKYPGSVDDLFRDRDLVLPVPSLTYTRSTGSPGEAYRFTTSDLCAKTQGRDENERSPEDPVSYFDSKLMSIVSNLSRMCGELYASFLLYSI